MTLTYLMKRRRQRANKIVKEINPEFVKDALICQLQTIFSSEIIDIDIPEFKTITIYTRKGGKSKTEKD